MREEPEAHVVDYMAWLREVSETEREAMTKGITAFTSYIRAYGNHHCPYIFQVKELDLGKLAYAFGLLYLPGMKEIKEKGKVEFVSSKVNPRMVKFVDKAREAERQKLLVKMEEEAKANIKLKKPKGKRTKKNSHLKNEDDDKPKKIRNATKRDLEELEVDYKKYRLEKKAKTKRHEYADVPEAEDDLSPISPETSRAESLETTQSSNKDLGSQRTTKRPRFVTAPDHKQALRASLREKLQSMQHMRQTKTHRKL